jgi:hypothetical protein
VVKVEDEEDDQFPLLQQNWDTVMLFLSVSTQWRVGMSGLIGMDYCAIEAMLRMKKKKITPSQFDGLQIMEREVLAALAEKQ